jgi:hypothetical protein
MKKTLTIAFALFVCATTRLFSQTAASTTEVDWFNSANSLLRDMNAVALSQGVAAVNTDGTLVQLGYFNGSTGLSFTGDWVPLTGAATAVPGLLPTTIGDSEGLTGAGNGRIAFTTVFHFNTNTPVVFEGQPGEYTTFSSVTITGSQPVGGQVLGVRFYDSNDASGKFNTVEAANWQWVVPTDLGLPVVLINLDQTSSPLVWQDAANPFKATLSAVPEPSTYASALLGLALFGVGAVRRRLKS